MNMIGPRRDLTGLSFGNLRVTAYSKMTKRKKTGYFHYWRCLCDCGNETDVLQEHLIRGHTKSCGCYKINSLVERSTKHGDANTRLYRIWTGMKARCSNSNRPDYSYYGEREIEVCEEWFDSFGAFKDWALANGYEDGLTIERINNNNGYSPENCCFKSRRAQARNKRCNIWVEYNGEKRLLVELAEKHGINPLKARARYHRGLNIDQILYAGNLSKVASSS